MGDWFHIRIKRKDSKIFTEFDILEQDINKIMTNYKDNIRIAIGDGFISPSDIIGVRIVHTFDPISESKSLRNNPEKVFEIEGRNVTNRFISVSDIRRKTEEVDKEIKTNYDSKKFFLVHGHDEGSKYTLSEIIRELKLEPVILHTQANAGKTIVEKIEDYSSDIGYAIVLLTPDDVGGINKEDLQPRARQNVILELGYFIGKLGRNRVCCIHKGNIEIPSDINGIAHLSYQNSVDECYRFIVRELQYADYLKK